ncbi:hypothetical protein [Spirosoma koreense]
MNALIMNLLLILLFLASRTLPAQSDDTLTSIKPFEMGMYMGSNWTINVILKVHQKGGVTLTVRNTSNQVIYRQFLNRSPVSYHQKINFEDSESGVYSIEVSDGRQTVVRRVDIVDIPSVASQRFITYGPQSGQ